MVSEVSLVPIVTYSVKSIYLLSIILYIGGDCGITSYSDTYMFKSGERKNISSCFIFWMVFLIDHCIK